jgi:hypothetical protein
VKGDLERLIEAVAAGEEYIERDVQDCFGSYRTNPMSKDVTAAYQGSLDAALRLHEALLPGWEWDLYHDGDVFLMLPDGHKTKRADATDLPGNPARSWLLAILRALAKREEG